MQPLDEYALMEWLKGEALKAHEIRHVQKCVDCSYNLACNVDSSDKLQPCAITGIKDFANKTISHIQNGRKNARPHIKERV
jgi:hypothetical protein